MTERKQDEVAALCAEIAKMAQRVGARFIPDLKKIEAFRKARGNGELAQGDKR